MGGLLLVGAAAFVAGEAGAVLERLVQLDGISAPSRKKGRSSGKNSGNRWLTSICGRSDSICEKSGLPVKSAVRFDVMPYFTFTPASGSVPRSTNAPDSPSSEPYLMAVNDGKISRLRLVDRSVMPSSTPICAMKLCTSRDIGAQTAFSSFFPRISRTI